MAVIELITHNRHYRLGMLSSWGDNRLKIEEGSGQEESGKWHLCDQIK